VLTVTATDRKKNATDQAAHRTAELAARTGLEPELAQRYAENPIAVLAEFGLSATEPLYLGGAFDAGDFVIEDLESPKPSFGVGVFTFCNV
jgi:hypothetical protein